MIEIRPANPTDCENIATVDVMSHRESYLGLLPAIAFDEATIPIRTNKWKELLIQSPPIRVYVAESAGELIGYAVGGPACGDEALGQQMQVQAIYLLDRVKRQGIGTKLLAALMRDFRACGANSAVVWMLRDNWPARRFYEWLSALCYGKTGTAPPLRARVSRIHLARPNARLAE